MGIQEHCEGEQGEVLKHFRECQLMAKISVSFEVRIVENGPTSDAQNLIIHEEEIVEVLLNRLFIGYFF